MTTVSKNAANNGIIIHGISQLVPSSPPIITSDFNCVDLAGTYQSDSRLFASRFGDAVEGLNLTDARNSLGEWMGLFQSSGDASEYVLTADSFGYQTVFYRIVSTSGGYSLFASGTASGLSALLQQNGFSTSVNWAAATSALVSNHKWADTLNSVNTFGSDVLLLKPGQYLRFSPHAISVEDFGFFESKEREDYFDLLDAGIERALRQVKFMADLPLRERRIHLSGGRDSRVMMAMLVAAGVEKKFTVSAANPQTWPSQFARAGLQRDLVLSNTMRDFYGMDWSKNDSYEAQKISFAESLQFWQSFRSNRNYGFPGGKGLSWPSGTHMELRGAGGATVRGYWVHNLGKLKSMSSMSELSEASNENLAALHYDLYPSAGLHPDVIEQSVFEFTKNLQGLGTSTIHDSLERHFTAFRHRAHFGHINHFLALNSVPSYPVSQPEFVRAGQLRTAGERHSGAVYFDIIERLEPRLNDLEFDTNQWSDSVRERRVKQMSPFAWQVLDGNESLDVYFANQEVNAKTRRSAKRVGGGSAGTQLDFDLREMCLNESRDVLHELRLSEPSGSQYLSTSICSSIMQRASSGKINPQTLVAKLHSIREMVVPADSVQHKMVDFNLIGREGASLVRAAGRPFLRSSFRERPKTITQQIEITHASGELKIFLNIGNPNRLSLEASYSLFVDEVIVETIPFERVLTATFNTDGLTGKVHVESTLRDTDAPELVFHKASLPILI